MGEIYRGDYQLNNPTMSRGKFLRRLAATATGVVTTYELITQVIPWAAGKIGDALGNIPTDVGTVDKTPNTVSEIQDITGISGWTMTSTPGGTLIFLRDVNLNQPLDESVSKINIPNGQGVFFIYYRNLSNGNVYFAAAVGAAHGKRIHFPSTFDNVPGYETTNLQFTVVGHNDYAPFPPTTSSYKQGYLGHKTNDEILVGPIIPVDQLKPSFDTTVFN